MGRKVGEGGRRVKTVKGIVWGAEDGRWGEGQWGVKWRWKYECKGTKFGVRF
jgi:hypothetical protein